MVLGLLKKKQTDLNIDELRAAIILALKNVFDPEIPVNIYDLGLVYQVDIDQEANVIVKMTLTTPGCPVAQTFPGTVEQEVRQVEGVNNVNVELVWEPPWTQDLMTEGAKLQLGLL
jgi:FeS assembly SUF system protein